MNIENALNSRARIWVVSGITENSNHEVFEQLKMKFLEKTRGSVFDLSKKNRAFEDFKSEAHYILRHDIDAISVTDFDDFTDEFLQTYKMMIEVGTGAFTSTIKPSIKASFKSWFFEKKIFEPDTKFPIYFVHVKPDGKGFTAISNRDFIGRTIILYCKLEDWFKRIFSGK